MKSFKHVKSSIFMATATLSALSVLSLSDVSVEAAESSGESTEAAPSVSTESHQESSAFVEGSQPGEDTVTITYTNDIHGRMEGTNSVIGMADASQYFEDVEADIIVDAGDAFQGLPLSNHDQGQAMAETMAVADYDAIAVGNHEFDFGQDVAQGYQEVAQTPVLSNNTVKDGQLMFDSSTSKEVTTAAGNTYNFGITGTTTPETATKTHPQNVVGVTFEEPVQATIAELETMIEAPTDYEAFIVLAHLGIDPATKTEWRGDYLAQQLDAHEAFDQYGIFVIDGHSHTAVDPRELDEEGNLKYQTQFGNVTYAQTGTALNNIGLAYYDPATKRFTTDLISKDEVDAVIGDRTDQEVQAIVDAAKAVYDEQTSAIVVENNPVWLNGVREYVRSQETNMGNLITDAMVDYGRSGGFNNPTSFAMINGGGIREQIVKDEPITEGDVIAVLPFGNIISQIEVFGEQIYDMFELAYSAPVAESAYSSSDGLFTVPAVNEETGIPNLSAQGAFLQVSEEITVFYDPTKEPGSRVRAVYLLDPESNEYKLVPNDQSQSYYMATNDFLAQGGDGYDMLYGAREEGPSLDQVVIDYIRQGGADLLNQYADPFPQERIVPITDDFDIVFEEVTGTEAGDLVDPGTGSPAPITGPGKPSAGTASQGSATTERGGQAGDTAASGPKDPADSNAKGQDQAESQVKGQERTSQAGDSVQAKAGAKSKTSGQTAASATGQATSTASKEASLPKTGASLGALGLGLTAILSGLGLAKGRRED